MNEPKIRFRRLSPTATLPTRGSDRAAGLDLYVDLGDFVGKYWIGPGQRLTFTTGFEVAVPSGTYGRVAPRSGLARKHGIDVLAGVVDEDYRGKLMVILLNTGTEAVAIQHGDRIAQLILEKYLIAPAEEVETLDDTARGGNGFGSTGA